MNWASHPMWILPALPAGGAVLIALGGRAFARRTVAAIAVTTAAAACGVAFLGAYRAAGSGEQVSPSLLALTAAASGLLTIIAAARGIRLNTHAQLPALCLLTGAALWLFTASGLQQIAAASLGLTAAQYILLRGLRDSAAERFLAVQLIGDMALVAAAATGVEAAAPLIAGAAVIRGLQLPVALWVPALAAGPAAGAALFQVTALGAGLFLAMRAGPSMAMIALGAVTALAAALHAAVQTDPRRVVAGAILTHGGLLFVQAGAGAASGALFHYITIASPALLLSFAAGVLVHVMTGLGDLRHMGGLHNRLGPVSALTVIAALCLAGFPGLGPFFSLQPFFEDLRTISPAALTAALVSVAVVSFALFRMILAAFAGIPRHHDEPQAFPRAVAVPLIAMAVPGVCLGWFRSYFDAWHKDAQSAELIDVTVATPGDWLAAGYLFLAALAGIAAVLRRGRDPAFVATAPRWRESAERTLLRGSTPQWAAVAAVVVAGFVYWCSVRGAIPLE